MPTPRAASAATQHQIDDKPYKQRWELAMQHNTAGRPQIREGM